MRTSDDASFPNTDLLRKIRVWIKPTPAGENLDRLRGIFFTAVLCETATLSALSSQLDIVL